MKKAILYTILAAGIVAILLLVFSNRQSEVFDKRITLDRRYKNPYGLNIAYEQLPVMFNNSAIKVNRASPDDWYDSDSCTDGKTIFFVVTRHFEPNTSEMHNLLSFVKQGNQVFISTTYMNTDAKEYFAIGEESSYNPLVGGYFKDSGTTTFYNPPFTNDTSFLNPGYHSTASFTDIDSLHYYVLSRNENGSPDLIKVNAGKGSFYFQSNPYLLANYFLLYHNNLNYFEKICSLMPPGQNKIIWDEYYVYRLSDNGQAPGPSPLHVLFSIAAFRWAFIISILLILVYIALNAKLLQRFIPAWEKPKNDTLDFTKTIGRLYFAKGDSTNLAKKMATYLLEYIRNKYFIGTTTLDEEFITKLASKSGYGEEGTKELVGNLVYIQGEHAVSEAQLAKIYESFSKFYKYTS